MRIFLFLLIFVPLLSFNQEKLDLRDLKSISSKSTFQKVVLENGFSKMFADEYSINYGYNLNKTEAVAETWAVYYPYTDVFSFQFAKDAYGLDKHYERIVREIQSSCTFHSIDEGSSYDIIYYGCPGAKFKGVIGYYDDGDQSFFIRTKLPTRN